MSAEKKQRVDTAVTQRSLADAVSTDVLVYLLGLLDILDMVHMKETGKIFQTLARTQLHQRHEIVFDERWARLFRDDGVVGAAVQAMNALVKRKGITNVDIIECDVMLHSGVVRKQLFSVLPEITRMVIHGEEKSESDPCDDFVALALSRPKLREFVVAGPPNLLPDNRDLEKLLLASQAPLTRLHFQCLDTRMPHRSFFTSLDRWSDGLARLEYLGLDVIYGDAVFLAALRQCRSLRTLNLHMLIHRDHVTARILTYNREVAIALADSKAPIQEAGMIYSKKQHGKLTTWVGGGSDEKTTTMDVYQSWSALSSLQALTLCYHTAAWEGTDLEIANAFVAMLAKCPKMTTAQFTPAPDFGSEMMVATMDKLAGVRATFTLGEEGVATDLTLVSQWLIRHPLASAVRGDQFEKNGIWVSDAKATNWDVLVDRFYEAGPALKLLVARETPLSVFQPMLRPNFRTVHLEGPELLVDNLYSLEDMEVTIVGNLSQLTADFFGDVARSKAKRVVLMEWKQGISGGATPSISEVLSKMTTTSTRGHSSDQNLLDRIRTVLDGKADSIPVFQYAIGERHIDAEENILPTEVFEVRTWRLYEVYLCLVSHRRNPDSLIHYYPDVFWEHHHFDVDLDSWVES